MSCCLPRQNCWDRNDWLSVKETAVPVLNLFGLHTPLGNSNFHAELYRHCELRAEGGAGDVCP